MQLDPQRYLDLVESSGRLVFIDTESSGGLIGDYGQITVATVKPFNQPPRSYVMGANFQDKGLVKEFRDDLANADCLVSFFGKGYDVPIVNTRLIRWGYKPLAKRHHIDLYFVLKPKLKTARKSQAHLLDFLGDTMKLLGIKPEVKMSVSPNVWADLASDYTRNINILKTRCESDCTGLESLYKVTRHLIADIKVG